MPSTIKKETIVFDNRREATAVFPSATATAQAIFEALGVSQPKAAFLIIGGADSLDEDISLRLIQLFGRGVARAAAELNALIIDGGTEAGVMKMVGQGVADRGFKSNLLGVAPQALVSFPGTEGKDKTPLDPNHSHFVLADGLEWGDETGVIFKLMDSLAAKVPTVVLVAGGGTVSKRECLQAVRQNLRLIVIEGTGGAADEIAAAWRARPEIPDDPDLAEIVADGKIEFHPLSGPVNNLKHLIIRGADQLLRQAWQLFADYDLNSILQKRRFYQMQLTILLLGILATGLALIKQVNNPDGNFNRFETWWYVYYVLLLIPILLMILSTAINRFKQDNKWILLRAAAEAIKREIYKYRARAVEYKEVLEPLLLTPAGPETPRLTPQQVLAQTVEDITRRVMQTEVNTSSLVSASTYRGLYDDDGFTRLTADRYVQMRLVDQFTYYRKKAVKLEHKLKLLQWAIFIIGGIGTLLAAINRQVWVALTTAITAAMATYLSYQQTENTLMKYNQASADLDSIRRWWTALPAEDQAKQDNVDALVGHTEKVLQSEFDGWVQNMQNALKDLRKAQTPQTDEEKAAAAKATADKAEAEKDAGKEKQ